jgi:hypothetical protein
MQSILQKEPLLPTPERNAALPGKGLAWFNPPRPWAGFNIESLVDSHHFESVRLRIIICNLFYT